MLHCQVNYCFFFVLFFFKSSLKKAVGFINELDSKLFMPLLSRILQKIHLKVSDKNLLIIYFVSHLKMKKILIVCW